MRHNRRRRIEDQSSKKSVQLLGLALFIMLLAFFIVLNAISTFEENKAEPILGSLENTFSTATSQIPQRLPSARPSGTNQEFAGEGDTTKLDQIRDLFRGRLKQVNIKENEERGIMLVEVPYAEFSTAIVALSQTATIREDVSDIPFLPTLVTLLQTAEDDNAYRMDMILNVSEDPIDMKLRNPDLFSSERNKIGKLSRRLSSAGIPDYHMSIGLRDGPENLLQLIFKPYQEIEAAGLDVKGVVSDE